MVYTFKSILVIKLSNCRILKKLYIYKTFIKVVHTSRVRDPPRNPKSKWPFGTVFFSRNDLKGWDQYQTGSDQLWLLSPSLDKLTIKAHEAFHPFLLGWDRETSHGKTTMNPLMHTILRIIDTNILSLDDWSALGKCPSPKTILLCYSTHGMVLTKKNIIVWSHLIPKQIFNGIHRHGSKERCRGK